MRKSKSPNNNSASTVQTSSLKSNLRKIKEQQIRELRNEQSNHNSSKSNRQKQINNNAAIVRALQQLNNGL
mgnify:FL=1